MQLFYYGPSPAQNGKGKSIKIDGQSETRPDGEEEQLQIKGKTLTSRYHLTLR
jgi:hypothetical protein